MKTNKNNSETIIVFCDTNFFDRGVKTDYLGLYKSYPARKRNKDYYFVDKEKNIISDWFESIPHLHGLYYMDEFGRYRGEVTNTDWPKFVAPECYGINKWQIDNLIIVDEYGRFRGTLSDLRAERGTLDVSHCDSDREDWEIYWKPFNEISQEELIIFLSHRGDYFSHGEALKSDGRGIFDPYLVDLIFPFEKALTKDYITCSPERAAELLINFDCIEDAIDCGEVILSPTDEGYYFNGAYYMINPHTYQEREEERAATESEINTFLTHLSQC